MSFSPLGIPAFLLTLIRGAIMSSAQAILAGAAIIALSIVFVNLIRPAKADMGGPYQLMHHANTVANASVFRLDTSSGDVSYCFVSNDSQLVCSHWVK
jgi:hypothetical protein